MEEVHRRPVTNRSWHFQRRSLRQCFWRRWKWRCYRRISSYNLRNTHYIRRCFGGSRNSGTTVGSTRVEISGGTLGYINGGGYQGDVNGECHLTISGTPTISGNVFGGSNQLGTTVGSTRVEISGGTFQYNIFGGGWGCNVQGIPMFLWQVSISFDVLGGSSQGQVFGTRMSYLTAEL